MMKAAGVTEELEDRDQMAWVELTNNCKAGAEEVILGEVVYRWFAKGQKVYPFGGGAPLNFYSLYLTLFPLSSLGQPLK